MKGLYTKRQRLDITAQELKYQRLPIEPRWKDLVDYIEPDRGLFLVTDTNRQERKDESILNNTATLAARTYEGGMMSGITPPSRPWKALGVDDQELMQDYEIKEWLYDTSSAMDAVLARSNFYKECPNVYSDIGTFATSAIMVEEDFTNVVNFESYPIGSYWVSNDAQGKVRTFMWEGRFTVRQLLEKFGKRDSNGEIKNWDIFSSHVKQLWELAKYETWVEVRHIIQPNDDYDETAASSKYKKFYSCYVETGGTEDYRTGTDKELFLRESGYDYFPVLVPRAKKRKGDSYGTQSPGMLCIGDVKELQKIELRMLEAIEKKARPPLLASPDMMQLPVTQLPGGTTYGASTNGQPAVQALYQLQFQITELEAQLKALEMRIDSAYFVNLFLAVANDERNQRATAQEISELSNEKLAMLVAVLEGINSDFLDPLIDIVFGIMLRQGLIREAPEKLQGRPLTVNYISIMATAQKTISLGALDKFIGTVAQLAQAQPEILDNIDIDEFVRVYAEFSNIPPKIVKDVKDVMIARAQRAKAQQAQAMLQGAQQAAGAAKDLSQADTSGDSVLTRLIGAGRAA